MISVLYVDDEPDLLTLGKIFLERLGGFSVEVIPSAISALDHLESHQYDAIISDYQMPGMDGIEFLKEVRRRYGLIPFILFTGKGREKVVILALNSGADFYLQKGGDPQAQFAELRNKIEKAVSEHRAIAAQKDSERRLSDIINFLPDATFAIDRKGKVISWNRAIEEMTGRSSDQMLGKGDFEYALPFYGTRRPILIDLIFSPPEEVTRYYSNIHKTGAILTAETTILHPDNSFTCLWGKASPLYDPNGDITGAIESIRDISDRKKAERALKESKEKYHEMSDLLPLIVYEADTEGWLQYANRIAFDTFGYSDEEFRMGLNVLNMIVPEEQKRVLRTMHDYLDGMSPRTGGEEYHARRKDGMIIPVTVYTSPVVKEGRVVGFRGVLVDTSANKRVEENLRERQRVLHTLISNLPGFVYRCENDRSWTMRCISAGCQDLCGYSPDEFVKYRSVTYNDIIHPDYRESEWKKWQIQLEKKDYYEGEYPIITRNGDIRWVWERGRGIYDDEGQLVFLEGFVTDITPRKQLEESLRKANRQLNLLTGITRHDIMNQLMMLKGYIEISKESFGDPVQTAAYLAKEEKVLSTIERQISFTRCYEDIGARDPSWRNVGSVIQSVIASLPRGDTKITVACPDLEVYSDPLFEKALYNLVDNAIRYGGEGMTGITFTSEKTCSGLVLVCEDNGAGITDADRPHLFERGFGRNTGFGLFLVREILGITGITIEETGKEGKGARFEMMVPEGAYRFVSRT